jgi:hypothetical protein
MSSAGSVEIHSGPSATTTAHRIVYNPENGTLYHTPTVPGPAPAVAIAKLSPNLALTNRHFRSLLTGATLNSEGLVFSLSASGRTETVDNPLTLRGNQFGEVHSDIRRAKCGHKLCDVTVAAAAAMSISSMPRVLPSAGGILASGEDLHVVSGRADPKRRTPRRVCIADRLRRCKGKLNVHLGARLRAGGGTRANTSPPESRTIFPQVARPSPGRPVGKRVSLNRVVDGDRVDLVLLVDAYTSLMRCML